MAKQTPEEKRNNQHPGQTCKVTVWLMHFYIAGTDAGPVEIELYVRMVR